MKTKINKCWKWLLGAVLGALGFESCDKILDIPQEYGQPYSEYKLIGDVKNVRKNPIPGIRVVFDRYFEEVEEHAYDTLYTNADGHFEKALLVDYLGESCSVKFEDVDGAENGSYRTKILTKDDLVIEQTKKGDNNWYEGAFSVHADAVLEEED